MFTPMAFISVWLISHGEKARTLKHGWFFWVFAPPTNLVIRNGLIQNIHCSVKHSLNQEGILDYFFHAWQRQRKPDPLDRFFYFYKKKLDIPEWTQTHSEHVEKSKLRNSIKKQIIAWNPLSILHQGEHTNSTGFNWLVNGKFMTNWG